MIEKIGEGFVYTPDNMNEEPELKTGEPLMWEEDGKIVIWREESYVPIILNDNWIKAFEKKGS